MRNPTTSSPAALGAPSDCTFHAPGPDAADYLVALVRG